MSGGQTLVQRPEIRITPVLIFMFVFITASCTEVSEHSRYTKWNVYGGGNESIRYSSLDQINIQNVTELEVAWTYKTGDADEDRNSQIQCNPIIVEEILYCTSPRLRLFALDAATGHEKWVFDPLADSIDINYGLSNNRGVTYWQDGEDKRILYTVGPFLYAIDAQSGLIVNEFGTDGRASLKQGLNSHSQELYVAATSPGILYKDYLIIGSRVSEGADAAPGNIRAFNVRTGKLEWTFHTIPHPGEFGYETWEDPDAWKKIGGANSWAGMALDKERGIVYIPTGSASPDFYGGGRKGTNLFANSLLALDAETGQRIWHFQTVRHDLWDRDLPSPPSLVTVIHEGELIDAVAQTTKTGYVFLINRETGEPLFPVEEKPVPINTELVGEQVWPTQPMPVRPEPFLRQHFEENDINPYVSDEDHQQIRNRLRQLDNDHMFAPPSLNGIVMFPGFDGGAEWGGNAFDPETGVLYVNSNEVPWVMTMVENITNNEPLLSDDIGRGRTLYINHCMTCHGADRAGSGNNPALINVRQNYKPEELMTLIDNGRRMMPGFSYLEDDEKKAIINFLLSEADIQTAGTEEKSEITAGLRGMSPYVMTGYEKFQTSDGYPAISPPWGTLNAIDLNSGEYIWRIPLGEYPELKSRGIPPTGTENYGGPVVTAGGLVFIAATPDEKFRAYNKKTGDLLWEADLPAAGFATPSTYMINDKQYIVIAAGGGKLGARSGDSYIAFALPD